MSEAMGTEAQGVVARGPWSLLWLRFKKNRVAVTGAVILAVLYLLACFAGFLSPYEFDDADTRAALYGPMLLGGYHAELTRIHVVEEPDGTVIEQPEYAQVWRYFDGGVHFRDASGRFTLRPHVHALREVLSHDEYGETEHVLAIDPSVSVPVRFFVRSERKHEMVSLCGLLPIRGHWHLLGVDEPETGGQSFARLYLLGSDRSGRDFLTRILHGGQISLSVGLVGILLTMSVAVVIGGVAGYFGGWVDFGIMRIVEILMAFPGLYLILTLRAAFPDNLTSRQTYLMVVAVLALAGWASVGRVIRGMVLSLREEEYALAARAIGATNLRVILRHVLPNTASFVIVTATLFVPYYILGEVALSFLGLGISEPETSWGLLLKDSQNTMILKYHPWLVIPGFFIFLAVLAYNFLGDGLRDAVDPRAILGN